MVPTTATELYPVRSYEIDVGGRLRPAALCNYLQESAGLHARTLGVSVEQLLEQGMTWFLWRLHLRVERLPAWSEVVEVETWPAELGRPYAVRDFRIRVDGQEIGVATSAWLLMDVASKRPIRRMPQHIRDFHPDPPRRALSDPFHRLTACGDSGAPTELRVRRADLDLNGHLNHVAAISALLEPVPAGPGEVNGVPPESGSALQLDSLEVEFRGEGHHGDRMASHCEPADDPGRFQHVLRCDDGRELARARSRWR